MGVNQQETQGSIDAALTFGLLWLDACREREAGRSVIEGLRLYVPPKTSATVQIRLAHLNHAAAKFQLFEFDERDESSSPDRSCRSRQHTNPPCAPAGCGPGALTFCCHGRARSWRWRRKLEIAVISATELSFRLHGLEFARVRLANAPGTFQVSEEVIFGPPGYETRLNDETAPAFAEFIKTVVEARNPQATGVIRSGACIRSVAGIFDLQERFGRRLASLDTTHVYSQVPAFSASDRAMIDVLTCTRDARFQCWN